MIVHCIFCGSPEETDHEIERPVCDRPECVKAAKDWAINLMIEAKTEGGKTMFRLRNPNERPW